MARARSKAKEAKMKILPPTERKKHRYVSFRVISEEPVVFSDLDSAIWNTALDFQGEIGVSKMDLWIIKNTWDEKNQSAVVRCSAGAVPQTVASLGILSRLGDNRIALHVQKISGTVKGLNLDAERE
jgi:RNase P/RNase MRP subunit POP5